MHVRSFSNFGSYARTIGTDSPLLDQYFINAVENDKALIRNIETNLYIMLKTEKDMPLIRSFPFVREDSSHSSEKMQFQRRATAFVTVAS